MISGVEIEFYRVQRWTPICFGKKFVVLNRRIKLK